MPPHTAADHFEMPVYGDEHQFATATPREPILYLKWSGCQIEKPTELILDVTSLIADVPWLGQKVSDGLMNVLLSILDLLYSL
jgi:hypothetical protein